MPDADVNKLRTYKSRKRQCGTTAVEFSMLLVLFLTLVFGVLEVARAMYLLNTLQEVTRRAAALASNNKFDATSISKIQAAALFADQDGNLVMGAPITPQYLKIDYLALTKNGTGGLDMTPADVAACPASNRLNCLSNPYSSSCIRLVRVRVCDPNGAGSCDPVPYQQLFPIVDLSALRLPRSTTIVPAQSLGYSVGSMPCP
jgi:hypothetical protein